MINTGDFLSKVADIFRERGWERTVSPATLLKNWELFVEECEIGYSGNLYEYFNDIRVREWIELIISAPELQGMSELEVFIYYVSKVDQKFQILLRTDITLPRPTWWEQGVLKYAGEELKGDFMESYGIDIQLLE